MADIRLPLLGENDPYGARSIPETEHLFTRSRLRRWGQGHRNHFHRTKNGVNDPLTFYHLTQALMNITPNVWFTSKQLVDYLNYAKPMLIWDAVTVGRVLNDLRTSFVEVNGETSSPLLTKRYWNGAHYAVTAFPEARTTLVNLLDDLDLMCADFTAAEAGDQPPRRLTSPLTSAPSLLRPTPH